MFDWKAKFKNKAFWVSIIPAVAMLITQLVGIFGFTVDLSQLSDQLIGIVGTVFSCLMILGITVNHNTPGISD